MTNALFRSEVLDEARQQGLGTVRLVRPMALDILAVVVTAMAVSAGAFLWFGQATRKVRVDGVVMPDRGLIRVMPEVAGVVQERLVKQGQSIRRGDPMFVLALSEPTLAAPQQQRVKESLEQRERSLLSSLDDQSQLTQQTATAASQRLLDLRRETEQIDAELALQMRRQKIAQASTAREQSLKEQGFVSDAQVQAALDEELAVQAQLAALQRQRAGQMRDVAALEADIRESPVKARVRRGEVERELMQLREGIARVDSGRRLVVKAPSDGTVAAVMADVGQPTTADAPLANVVPSDTHLEAHLYAPSRAIGFLKPGQTVALRLQAFPHQKFGAPLGHIVQVANAPWRPPADDPEAGVVAGGEPVYRITVALPEQSLKAYGQQFALVAGMQLEADVLLDRRRLVEWLFEPLLGWAGRL